ncbi:MAG: hypothetical protein SH808_10635 [Saprospiraceae bacterium]|nr:hypothetical protein [Saprospiraceae bacterium]
MFYKSLLFLTIVLVFIIVSCSTAKEYPGKFSGQELHFGQGGGFTGAVTYFVLLDDGRLYQRAMQDSIYTLLDTWDERFVKQMFDNYKSFGLEEIEFYEPGDLYYFIQHKSGDSPMHRITWGRPGVNPDEIIVRYYNLLYKSTKSNS